MLEERRPEDGGIGGAHGAPPREIAAGGYEPYSTGPPARETAADAAPQEAASASGLPGRRPPADAAGPGGASRAFAAWRDPATWVIAACVLGAYLVISLYRLFQLSPSSWDLGIYTEYVKQFANLHAPIVDVRGPGFNLLGDHFQVIVALIAPFFRVFPAPATLLVAQALLTAVSVFPVVAAGAELLGRGAGRAIGFAYGFSWGLQQMVNFDFHEIAFAVPLLAFSLSALVRGRTRAAVCWALPLVAVKEDQGFTVAAIGAVMAIAGARGWRLSARPRADTTAKSPRGEAGAGERGFERSEVTGGLFLVWWGLSWSLLEIGVLIPHFSATHRYAYWNLGGVVGGGPAFSAGGLLGQLGHAYPVKLETLVILLLATAFIALGSPVAAIAVPSLVLRFIATNDYYWGTMWHYNATVMPILFLAAIEAMARWRAGERARWRAVPPRQAPPWWLSARAAASRHGAAMMVAIAVALAFQYPLSGLWNGQTYQIGKHAVADEAAMAVVPDGATVTTTLNLLAPLAARTDTFWVGNDHNPDTQYIVFDGPDSGYSPAVTNVPAFVQQQLYPKAGYRIIFQDDDVFVFQRG
jgi:uncharacterized membrane protein